MRIGARPPCRQLGRKAKQKPSSALLPLRTVTLNGGGKAGGEVDAGRAPAQLAAQLGAVDGVAAVVAGAVAHPVEVVLRPRVRMAHAVDEWSSVLLQSRTLRPSL